LRFADKLEEELAAIRELKRRIQVKHPSEVAPLTHSLPAVYQVKLPAGRVRDFRNWKWVSNLALAIRSGRDSGGIQPRDTVQFIVESTEKRGNEIASLMRRAEAGLF
jgi:hypothetical protein